MASSTAPALGTAGFEPNIAFVTRDVLAFELVASGLAVTLTGRLLAGLESRDPGRHGRPGAQDDLRDRAPGTDSHPMTDRLLEELAESSGSPVFLTR